MRRKQKSIQKFIVDHLQKVILFVSGLKFWNMFCLSLLLIANSMFHADLISPPNYQEQKNILIGGNIDILSSQPLAPDHTTSSLSTLTVVISNGEIKATNTKIKDNDTFCATSSDIKKQLSSDNSSHQKTQTKSKIIITILTIMTIIEHAIPARFLKILTRLVRK